MFSILFVGGRKMGERDAGPRPARGCGENARSASRSSGLPIRGALLPARSLLALQLGGTARAQEAPLVPGGSEWAWFKGVEPPDADWKEIGYDDTDWLRGAAGIGYGDGDDVTVVADMQGSYASIYFRRAFTAQGVGTIERLSLSIDYDDGFVAYLNGEEVARSGLVGLPPPFDELARDHEAGTFEEHDLAIWLDLLEAENVLAVQVHNATLDSSDFSFDAALTANGELCPTDLDCSVDVRTGSVALSWTGRAVYDRVEILRDGEVIAGDVDGAARSYVDRGAPASDVSYEVVAIDRGQRCEPLACVTTVVPARDVLIAPGDEWRYFPGRTEPAPDWREVEFDDGSWLLGPTGIGYGNGDDRTELLDMQNEYLSVFCRRKFVIGEPRLTRDLLLSATYDDGVVVYVNGEELGRFNIDPGRVGATTAATATVEPSLFEISISPDRLRAGENVLACSVHNAALSSTDLSFVPTLIRRVREPARGFRRGDVTQDLEVDVSDAVGLLAHLFQGQLHLPCPDAADVNDDGAVDVTDVVYVFASLFGGGPAPLPPGLECGVDPTPDALGECTEAEC